MNTTACFHVTADPSFFKQLAQRFHTGFQRRSVNGIRVKDLEGIRDSSDSELAAVGILDPKHFLPENGREIRKIVARQLAGLKAAQIPVARPSSATAHQLSVNKTFTHQTKQSLVHGSSRNREMPHDV